MKAFRIFAICLSILYFAGYIIANIYFDHNAPNQAIYWLIGQLGGLIIIPVCWIFVPDKSKSAVNDRSSPIFSLCFGLIFVAYYGYKSISDYRRNVCQDKFAWVFNKQRQILGVPCIPNDWKIRFRGTKDVEWWKSEKDTVGHVSKDISIDSACNIVFENDGYNFRSVKRGFSRNLTIMSFYAKGKALKLDSIIYRYEPVDNHYQKITRQQADSLFTAEKIKKDY